ncbi:MAG: hypothetical protein A2Y57_03875 [Candidatus Woykebacteria bacterium RBG_13_40_7b]|uniref:Carbonic anhydrase n=1 Tax=Candidatus Woykebacteria bacterium RBG_13_40_7b TaxID=1802594 RepID=A0A1G1WAZ8_9BACT|nr:MAG: hypothetical protein A2Y57_03875 [Candidatus Woykebacteria bacterium RBG_13_40_7b]
MNPQKGNPKAAIVYCLDPDIDEAVGSFLDSQGLHAGTFTRHPIQGGPLNIRDVEKSLGFVINYLGVRTIWLIGHVICRAMELELGKNDDDAHAQCLRGARSWCHQRFPSDVGVRAILMRSCEPNQKEQWRFDRLTYTGYVTIIRI